MQAYSLADKTPVMVGNLNYAKKNVSKICKPMHTGDSGGPLVVKNAAFEVYEVIGLTKGGDGCGARNIPGLYTSIVTYLPWIKKHRDQYGWMLQQQQGEDWVPSSIIKTSFSGENLLTDHLWPDGEVPYRVESTFSSGQLEKIARAMEDISAAVPCVHFRFTAKNILTN